MIDRWTSHRHGSLWGSSIQPLRVESSLLAPVKVCTPFLEGGTDDPGSITYSITIGFDLFPCASTLCNLFVDDC